MSEDRDDPIPEDADEEQEDQVRDTADTKAADEAAASRLLTETGRIEILKGSKFITKEPNYETSLFSKWENINKKFHLLGWRHLRSWRAYVEMFSELQVFLYEIAGNVDRERRQPELDFLEAELARIRQRPQRLRIPLMYNLASHLFHNVDLGLKKPSEKSIFDLDVDEIFRKHGDSLQESHELALRRKEILKP